MQSRVPERRFPPPWSVDEADSKLEAVVPCQPAQAQGHSGSAVVIDRWFDVMCYGKSR